MDRTNKRPYSQAPIPRMPRVRFRGSTRGIFGLKTWDIPGMPFDEVPADEPTVSEKMQSTSDRQSSDVKFKDNKSLTSKPVGHVAPQRQAALQIGTMLIAKYSYTANPNSPLGSELTIAQGDKLKYLDCYDDNWWLVEDKLKEIGYVPARYLVNLDDLTKPTSMPWLQSQASEAEERVPSGEKKYYKKYVSTYEHEEVKRMKLKEYYCEICDKQLNGPQPYRAHMNSKAHKETEEYYREDNDGG